MTLSRRLLPIAVEQHLDDVSEELHMERRVPRGESNPASLISWPKPMEVIDRVPPTLPSYIRKC